MMNFVINPSLIIAYTKLQNCVIYIVSVEPVDDLQKVHTHKSHINSAFSSSSNSLSSTFSTRAFENLPENIATCVIAY